MAQITVKQAEKKYFQGLSRRAWYRYIEKGFIPTTRLGRKVYIDEEELLGFIDRGGSSIPQYTPGEDRILSEVKSHG